MKGKEMNGHIRNWNGWTVLSSIWKSGLQKSWTILYTTPINFILSFPAHKLPPECNDGSRKSNEINEHNEPTQVLHFGFLPIKTWSFGLGDGPGNSLFFVGLKMEFYIICQWFFSSSKSLLLLFFVSKIWLSDDFWRFPWICRFPKMLKGSTFKCFLNHGFGNW